MGPAGGRDHPPADVDGDRDARPVGLEHGVEEVAVAEGGRADDGTLGAGAQGIADRGGAAQAAAVLDRHAGLGDDALEVPERARRAALGAVEVDDVQPARAGLDPRAGGVEWIVVVDGLVLEAALAQAHRAALEDVDGGIEVHARTVAHAAVKLPSRARPAREDFSGWNCAPITLPCSTMDGKVSPYSPVPTTSAWSEGRQTKEWTW